MIHYQHEVNGRIVKQGVIQPFRLGDRTKKTLLQKLRIGDKVAAIATPIARKLKLNCIDPKTKDLRPESKCAGRKATLNGK